MFRDFFWVFVVPLKGQLAAVPLYRKHQRLGRFTCLMYHHLITDIGIFPLFVPTSKEVITQSEEFFTHNVSEEP